MDLISGGVIVGGLIWHYCSIACIQRNCFKLIEDAEEEFKKCATCLAVNAQMLEAPDDETTLVTPDQEPEVPKDVIVEEPAASIQQMDVCEQSQPMIVVEAPSVAAQMSSVPTSPCRCCKCKAGKITSNPFLNYMRERRPFNCRKPQNVLAKECGEVWKQMQDEEKAKYTEKNIRKHRKNKTKLEVEPLGN